MMLNAGTKLGPYEIVGAIGAGGMGEVYRARDTRLGRDVAIKILPEHLTEKPEARQRFEREARAISSLQHPNICTLYDVGHQDGTDFLVMEFLEGETLAKRLERGPVATAELLRIGIEVSDALEKAHRQGVIHRDLKPSNIMLTKSGAKLMDFGLAKAAGDGAAPALESLTQSIAPSARSTPVTAQGTIVGTFQYMSPEQMEGKEADARSDIFSLGAVLYEMATGKRAFEGKTTASVIAAILEREPPAISSVQPMSPPALDRTVKICLAKEADERFQSAHDVKLQLEWIREAGSQAGVPAPVVAHRKHRERIAWAAAALLAIVAIALAYGFVVRAPQAAHAVISQINPPANTTFALSGGYFGASALSPDGTRLAFVAVGSDGLQRIWIKPLDSPAPLALAGTEGAEYPFWSPDGLSLGFFANGKLYRISASGGQPFAIANAAVAYGGSWGPDGTIIYSVGHPYVIFRVAASGGAPQAVTQLLKSRGDFGHLWPQFLPDGKHFLFYIWSSDVSRSAVYAGSLDGGEAKLVLQSSSAVVYVAPGYLLFVLQGALMAQRFDAATLQLSGYAQPILPVRGSTGSPSAVSVPPATASETGVLVFEAGIPSGATRLLWFDRNGKQIGETGEPAHYATPHISPQGDKLAVAISEPQSPGDLWVFDLATGLKRRINFSNSFNVSPRWSADEKTLAFRSNRGGSRIAWFQKPADGTGITVPLFSDKLLQQETGVGELEWTRDGRYLVFFREDLASLFAMPLSGDRKPLPVFKGADTGSEFSVSPDGKWLAYARREADQDQIVVAPFPHGSGEWQVSTNGGRDPHWRRDGKELFYFSPDNQIMAAEVSGEGATFTVSKVVPLFHFRSPAVDVSPDGQKFLMIQENTQVAAPLTLVTNWPALLKKQ